MIDTVVMIIPYNEVRIVDFWRFKSEAEITHMSNLHLSCASDIPHKLTKDEKNGCYLPRLKLRKTPYPFIANSFFNLFIECSLPKILFNNNVEEVAIGDLETLITRLKEKILQIGVCIEDEVLRKAYISRIDFSKNFFIEG